MPITRTAMIDDDGSGTTGTIFNNAWKQELYNQIDGLGAWTAIPFNAGNFSGFTVTAGQVTANRYAQIGKTVIWNLSIDNATITGTPATLSLLIPPSGAIAAAGATALVNMLQGGAWGPGRVVVAAGSPNAQVSTLNFAAFTAGAFYLQGVYIYEVQ